MNSRCCIFNDLLILIFGDFSSFLNSSSRFTSQFSRKQQTILHVFRNFCKIILWNVWASFNYIPVTFAAKSPAHFPQLICTNIVELREELFSQINIETWSHAYSFFINQKCVVVGFKRPAFHSNQRVKQQQIPLLRIPTEFLRIYFVSRTKMCFEFLC